MREALVARSRSTWSDPGGAETTARSLALPVVPGRNGDSLTFAVMGGQAPPGYPSAPAPGFRYDLPPDSAVVLPLVVPPPAPGAGAYPDGLPAYPYFAYFTPGAQLMPPTPFSPALTVAGTLRAHCRFEVTDSDAAPVIQRNFDSGQRRKPAAR